MKDYDPQPMQPVVKDDNGVVRFRPNAIIRYLTDHLDAAMIHADGGLDLNKLARLPFAQEDREQFAQLIGYSVSGYHDLSYVSDESCARASKLADQVMPGAGGCRDKGCEIHEGPLFDDDGKRIT